ncbi:MAG: DUF4351 domain-containing protein [Microcystaceae cyanobacterium]
MQEGRQDEAVFLIVRQLTRRLGTLSASHTERIRGLSVPQLEELGEALLDFQFMVDLEQMLGKMGG